MKAEKVILSTIAVIVGLIAAGIAFYLYQMTKTLPPDKTQTLSVKSQITPSPTPNNENFLTLENPKDESVVNSKIINISGKTTAKTTIIVSTENNDQVITPADNGDFTLSDTIGDGTNMIQITAVFPNGEEKKVIRTVTYSTENF
jgi:hypothetical protein